MRRATVLGLVACGAILAACASGGAPPSDAPAERADGAAADADALAMDVPAPDAQATDAATMDTTASDAPVTDASTTDVPAMDAPGVDAPASDVPTTDAPTGDAPGDGGAADAGASIAREVVGDDWHLPAGLTPEPHSGIYTAGRASVTAISTIVVPQIPWAAMHRGDGVYDFSTLDGHLARGPVVLRMWCGSPTQVPAFVRARHAWPTFTNSEGDVELPQWSPGWLDEWRVFVDVLGARYRDHPNLVGFQLQVSADGEAFMTPSDVENFERLGMTPDVIRTFFDAYYRGALAAFSGHAWKVFTVMKPYFFNAGAGRFDREDYARAVRAATLPNLAAGMGIRGSGFSERYHFPADWSEWSEFRDAMVVTHDNTFAPLLNHAHVDGQLENWYGPNAGAEITTRDPNLVRYAIRLSLLRGLADQYSHIWLDGDDAAFLEMGYPGLARYAQLVLGRRPSESPDALLVLGQWTYNATTAVHAWPRWIVPLNLAATRPGVMVDTTGLGYVSSPQHLGRTFSTPLALAVDDRFLPPAAPPRDAEVLVEYRDDDARWALEYQRGTSPALAPTVGGGASGQWRTVTIQLRGARFGGALAGGADLRVVPMAGAPTVQVVRVIR